MIMIRSIVPNQILIPFKDAKVATNPSKSSKISGLSSNEQFEVECEESYLVLALMS